MTQPTVASIKAAVAEHYKLEPRELLGDDRHPRVSHPRQVAMFLAVRLTAHTGNNIARLFKRDHSTVIYAERAVEKRCASDPKELAAVETLWSRLVGEEVAL